ncbi:MAG: UbiD family decarboxylase [Thermofilum sp.]|nr:UbiD family decarboxylase [Thermofilum sp.]MCC6058935.1 UbiD family decarboxylase [Thermofilum sp.]
MTDGVPQADLRDFLKACAQENKLKLSRSPLRLEFEVAAAIKAAEPHPLVVRTERGHILSNVLADRRRLLKAISSSSDAEAYRKLLEAMNNPVKLRPAEVRGYLSLGDDLGKLPIPKFFERDGGYYLTAGIFLARDPETSALNASIHRAMVLDEKRLAVRLVPRHLHYMFSKAEKSNKPLPAAIVIGAAPAVYVAAASSPPYGVYEVEVANALVGGVLSGTSDLIEGIPIPLPSEYIILGEFLPGKRAREGPFVDILGTYDEVREEPVFLVHDILARSTPLFYAILPSGLEHRLLMGFPREAAIWDSVSRVVPRVRGVRLTPGGGSWLVAVVSIAKVNEGDPKNVILAALAAHPSLKIVVVVDEDIDPDDAGEVEWAIATRMQPSEDLVVVTGARGSSLDPSADPRTLLTSKLGVDATKPLSKSPELFEKARIPVQLEPNSLEDTDLLNGKLQL